MGWTKDPSAILVLRQRLNEVRAELRGLVGKLHNSKARRQVASLLREHERLSSALAHGRRDGTIHAEIGVRTHYTDKNLGHFTQELLSKGPEDYTFKVDHENAVGVDPTRPNSDQV